MKFNLNATYDINNFKNVFLNYDVSFKKGTSVKKNGITSLTFDSYEINLKDLEELEKFIKDVCEVDLGAFSAHGITIQKDKQTMKLTINDD
jgi:hypothetical protein